GGTADFSVALSLSPKFASFGIESDPPGAQILQNGELLAGRQTPISELLVPANANHVFTLRLMGYQPAQLPVRLGRGETGEVYKVTLERGGGFALETNVPGTVSVTGQEHC